MGDIQKIKLKRTKKALTNTTLLDEKLDFGEPLFIKTEDPNASLSYNGYFVVGKEDAGDGDEGKISRLKFIKAQKKEVVDNGVFHKTASGFNTAADAVQLTDDEGVDKNPKTTASNVSYGSSNLQDTLDDIFDGSLKVKDSEHADTASTSVQLKTHSADDAKYWILGVVDDTDMTDKDVYHARALTEAAGVENTGGIYFDQTGVLVGAAWNDFAEFRKCEVKTPGICVVETGDGELKASRRYRNSCAYIISDTYGMVIGEKEEEDYAPVAVAGRVLAFVDKKEKLKAGDALKTAPGGRLARMNRLEKIIYPDKIIGYVSEIPTYERWNNIEVNNRVWVRI